VDPILGIVIIDLTLSDGYGLRFSPLLLLFWKSISDK
jgi:hypothetical protein